VPPRPSLRRVPFLFFRNRPTKISWLTNIQKPKRIGNVIRNKKTLRSYAICFRLLLRFSENESKECKFSENERSKHIAERRAADRRHMHIASILHRDFSYEKLVFSQLERKCQYYTGPLLLIEICDRAQICTTL
jgi:hypothetical protein